MRCDPDVEGLYRAWKPSAGRQTDGKEAFVQERDVASRPWNGVAQKNRVARQNGSMRKTKTPLGTADETEHAFYEALQQADIDRLMACWADDDDIVCVHPGGPRLVGHAAVRAAFETLFSNGSVKAHPEKVRRIDAGTCSVHSLVERVEILSDDGPQQAWVVATNVYAKTAQGWRLLAHHASPGSRTEPPEVSTAPPVLH